MKPNYPKRYYDLPETLKRIGVPADLLRRDLKSFNEGVAVWQWMKNGGFEGLLRGENWFFETTNLPSVNTLPMLVQTIAINTSFTIKFVRSAYLARLVAERNYRELDLLASLNILVIGDFFEASRSSRECGMTAHQRNQIENLLLERNDQSAATVFQIHNPYGLIVNHLAWWRNSVFDQLEPRTLKIATMSPAVPSLSVSM